jgi:hypothetical protein
MLEKTEGAIMNRQFSYSPNPIIWLFFFLSDSLTRKYLTLSKEGLAKQEKELKSAYQKMFKQPDKSWP